MMAIAQLNSNNNPINIYYSIPRRMYVLHDVSNLPTQYIHGSHHCNWGERVFAVYQPVLILHGVA